MKPYQPITDFELALCEYTGAPYAVAVNSCTSALMLAVAWHLRTNGNCRVCGLTAEALQRAGGHLCDRSPCDWQNIKPRAVEIPTHTYVGVPMAIMQAGGIVKFREERWQGLYQLKPLPVWDCARMFTSKMYGPYASGHMLCVSFHASKILGDTQGGAILLDDAETDAWLRRARLDGRTDGVDPLHDNFTQIGWHVPMTADVATRLLLKLSVLPRHNDDLPNSDYPDLSQFAIFK